MVTAPRRLALVGLAGMALLAGMWAGLLRIGWQLPPLESDLATLHGPLMLGGFLGLVISLERAVALGRSWAYAAPACAAISTLTLLAGLPLAFSAALLAVSSGVLIAIFERIYRLRRESSTLLMLLGAASWLVGNALWLGGRPIINLVPWWVGFLVLTIVGERLELAQVLLPANTRALMLLGVSIMVAGLALSTTAFNAGVQVAGAGMLGLSAWLAAYDVVRRSLRRKGLARFSGVALLLGYLWLGLAALVWVLGPERAFGGFWYDAMLHTIFIGFALSMVFGHAPTIVPAIAGVAVPFQSRFYVHLVLLHVSLLLRIIGDLATQPEVRRWGGLLNVVAILLFAALTFAASRSRQAEAATL